MYWDMAGDPGELGCGDQAGLNPAGLIQLASPRPTVDQTLLP